MSKHVKWLEVVVTLSLLGFSTTCSAVLCTVLDPPSPPGCDPHGTVTVPAPRSNSITHKVHLSAGLAPEERFQQGFRASSGNRQFFCENARNITSISCNPSSGGDYFFEVTSSTIRDSRGVTSEFIPEITVRPYFRNGDASKDYKARLVLFRIFPQKANCPNLSYGSTLPNCTFKVREDTFIKVEIEPVFNLSVKINGPRGTVSLPNLSRNANPPLPLNCRSGICNTQIRPGVSTFTANINQMTFGGFDSTIFDSWAGDCAHAGKSKTCQIDIQKDTIIGS